jgi:hypothetical protein
MHAFTYIWHMCLCVSVCVCMYVRVCVCVWCLADLIQQDAHEFFIAILELLSAELLSECKRLQLVNMAASTTGKGSKRKGCEIISVTDEIDDDASRDASAKSPQSPPNVSSVSSSTFVAAAAAAPAATGHSSKQLAPLLASPVVPVYEPHVSAKFETLIPSEKVFRANMVSTLTCMSSTCGIKRTTVEPFSHISLDLLNSMATRGIPTTSRPDKMSSSHSVSTHTHTNTHTLPLSHTHTRTHTFFLEFVA